MGKVREYLKSKAERKKEFAKIVFYKELSKDLKFRKYWEKEKRIRVLEQKNCRYCGAEFSGDKGAVLHHTKIFDKEREAQEKLKAIEKMETADYEEKKEKIKQEIINYYKSLADTDLICLKCHAREHSNIIRKNYVNRMKKLF